MAHTTRFRPPSQEMMLLDLIQRLGPRRAGRVGIHLHLSQLSKAYDKGRYAAIAMESFATYVSGFEGQLFALESGDLFFLSKNTTRTLLEAAVERVQQLFSQDPLIQKQAPDGHVGFCTWYDLSEDYDAVLGKAQEFLADAEKRHEIEEKETPVFAREIEPIGPTLLSKLEHSLESADVTVMARRQMVCTIIDEMPPQPLFEEIFVSIDDLQRVVSPGVDLSANIWLFRYLTRTLDRRIMRMLVQDGVDSKRPFSINLNVSTVLTAEFAKFEAVIAPQLRGRLVIELNKLDVFSDMGAYLFARDYLHDHGFRLCLDGLTHHTLRYCDRSNLGFDLVKLFWAPNAVEDILPSMVPDVRNIIKDTGQAHTILCRCDNERAIQTGQELGIVMFQGRAVDKRMEAAFPRKPFRL